MNKLTSYVAGEIVTKCSFGVTQCYVMGRIKGVTEPFVFFFLSFLLVIDLCC